MREFIDTLFSPIFDWLQQIMNLIEQLSVPVARGINVSYYLSPFYHLGTAWTILIVSTFSLAAIYLICYMIVSNQGLFIKFKDMIKWW